MHIYTTDYAYKLGVTVFRRGYATERESHIIERTIMQSKRLRDAFYEGEDFAEAEAPIINTCE